MTHSGLVHYHPALTELLTPIDDIHPHPDNPNNGDTEHICASIETNGMYRPIYAQRTTRHILAGNHTWYACKQLDATHIPVIWLDCDDTTAHRILGADNWTARLAHPDPAAELALLQWLTDNDTLYGTGKTDHDLQALADLADTPLSTDDYDWTLISIRVPPSTRHTWNTISADTNLQRLHTLMKMAGLHP